jgi:structural maintenance of chromosome 3 (chondroitin sulfate proteoglycan 6)
LESFPRQNKNCIEYFEKYNLKYDELHSKFTQHQKMEDQIKDLVTTLKDKKAKSLEENFKMMSRNFSEIFKNIVPDGFAQLKLIKLSEKDLSQQTE